MVTRVTVIATGIIAPLLASAAPVFASPKPDDGEVLGPSLGLGNTILLFVVVPLAVFGVIAALSVLPSALSKPRYRPGKPWDHEARWIGGPVEPAVVDKPDSTARGGTSAEW